MSSYCSHTDVAPLASVWTASGVFNENTRPKATQVTSWIEQISGMLDSALATEGFVVPITAVPALPMLKIFTASIVADMCHASNSSGRFFTTNVIERGINWFGAITSEINAWASANAIGIENLGATRRSTNERQIGFREFDENGNKISPIFQREAFGNKFNDGA